MLLFIAAATFGQQVIHQGSFLQQDYLQKSAARKETAWGFLAGGAVLNIIGLATFPKNYAIVSIWGDGNSPSTASKATTSGVMLLIGSASMLASIPFFISAHHNRKKAISVTIDTQQMHGLKKTNLYTVSYPALTMKLTL